MKNAVLVDIETSGLFANQSGILKIEAIKFDLLSGKTLDQFQVFTNPAKIDSSDANINPRIDEVVVELTGITNEMVIDAPCNKDAVAAFLNFANKSDLWAFNSKFHVDFLGAYTDREAFIINDVMGLAKTVYPDIKNYLPNTVAQYLKIDPNKFADDLVAGPEIKKEILLKCLHSKSSG